MKKALLSLLCGLMVIPIFTGCGNNENKEKPNFEVLDSKIDYIVIKDKKIYLTRNFRDFTLQFKGLGCEVIGAETKEIDSIDENDPLLTQSARTNYIYCYNTDEKEYYDKVSITMHTYTEDQGDINDIYWFQFSSTKGLFDLHINNKTLLFGTEDRVPSTTEDLIEIFGSDFEEESGTYSEYYNYIEEKYEYDFRYDAKTNELEAFSITIE